MKTLEEAIQSYRQYLAENERRTRRMKYDGEAILRSWYRHKHQRLAGEEVGVSDVIVSLVLRRAGIHIGRGVRTPSLSLPIDEIQRLYREGESTGTIGKMLGCCAEVIRERLMISGVARRQAGAAVGPRNSQWKGGRSKRPLAKDRGPHRLARAVASLCLQRRLLRTEIVHHMDNDPLNNDPKNLWLFPSIGHHLRYHQQLLASRHADGSEFAIRLALENDGQTLPLRYDLIGSALDISRQRPYGSLVLIKNLLKGCGLMSGKLARPRAPRKSK